MILIGDCILSQDILEEEFSCNIQACKGACCIEGDAGAPLDKEEIGVIEEHLSLIKQKMDATGIAVVEEKGVWENDPFDEPVTVCKSNGECAFAIRENGILSCAIERANEEHSFGFKKPISCHLYPIRIKKYQDFLAVNYHKWSICSAACEKGKANKIKVFEFAKDALLRKFGSAWFKELEEIAQSGG